MAACALFVANTINVGADLTGMSDAVGLLTGVSSHVWVFALGLGIAVATVRLRYETIAKWLGSRVALVLVAYIITALYIGPQRSIVAHDTFVPQKVPRAGGGAWGDNRRHSRHDDQSLYLFSGRIWQEAGEEKARRRRGLLTGVGEKPAGNHYAQGQTPASTFSRTS